jgi:hypothetical protein
MPTETPSQYRQRVADNARKTGAPRPVQNRSNIPSPAQKPLVLPKVVSVPFAWQPEPPEARLNQHDNQ